MMIEARRVARIDFTASDLAASMAFYEALGFKPGGILPVDGAELMLLGLPESRAERLLMRLGDQEVGFLRFDPPGRPYPADSTSTDLWFQHIAIAVSDMAEAHRRALAAGAVPITRDGPQTLPTNTGGVTAFKFRDPDGHPLELLSFPAGVGAAAWQAGRIDNPFLGIDHTALSAGDADQTTAFFAGLGFRAAASTHNQGPRAGAARRCRRRPLPRRAAPAARGTAPRGTAGLRGRPAPPHAGRNAGRRPLGDANLDRGRFSRGRRHDAKPWPCPAGVRAALLHDPDGHAVVLMESGEPA